MHEDAHGVVAALYELTAVHRFIGGTRRFLDSHSGSFTRSPEPLDRPSSAEYNNGFILK
jgi:hypothetical protein